MSETARVVVIGGGIVGCSILYHLTKAGCADAMLIERAELTAGATWHAAGNVHTQSAYPNLSALQAYSLKLYDGLAEEVGQEVGSHVVGGFFLARSQERMEEFKFLAGKFKALGIEYDLVTPDEVKAKHPLIDTSTLVGAAWDPLEGYVDPYSVTMGLAAGAKMRGGTILRNHRVERIDRTAEGWRVHAAGRVIDCEIVVNAGGFWADAVARMVGARLPITNMEHHYLVTESLPSIVGRETELPMIRDMDWDFYMRQEGDGLLVGPWEKDCRAAWDNKQPPWSFGQELFQEDFDRLGPYIERICECVPDFAEAGIKRTVNGAISFSPDARPMIGPLPGAPNFFVACGFLGGIAQGGGIGLAMSQWILKGEPDMDLSFIDVARFGDWTTKDFARQRTYEVFPRRYEIIHPHLERQTGRGLRATPMTDVLRSRGAVMGQAQGWERPLWFGAPGDRDEPNFGRPNWWSPVKAECEALAAGAGLIDMSPYAKFDVTGPDASAFLDHVGSAKVPGVDGKIALSLLLNPRGGIVGDMTVCRLAEDRYRLISATLGEGIHHRWLTSHADGFDVRIDVVTERYAVLGLAGPESRGVLQDLSEDDFSPEGFRFMTARPVEIGAARCLAMRVSYSGEMGWELHVPIASSHALLDALLSHPAPTLVGSRALGWLRLEKGYRSWGHEMTTEISPRAAGLERFCSKSKDYIGRTAVETARDVSPDRVLATLAIDETESDCWGSEPIFSGATLVGYVTSGGFGARVGRSLAVGWIDADAAEPGTKLGVDILTVRHDAIVVADAVYDPGNEKLLG